MKNPGAFYTALRSGLLGPTLSDSEVQGVNAILTAMAGDPLAYTAFALATAYLETAHTMQPIGEYGSDTYFFRRYDPSGQRPDIAKRLGNTQRGDGAKFKGRGYVQLTGRANYAKAAGALDVDLIGRPELALSDDVAAKIMRRGMDEGWFTGRSFRSFLPDKAPADRAGFAKARAIINGNDRADDVAGYAVQFQQALALGGWGQA